MDENGELTVNPIITDDRNYFRLTGVRVPGKEYDVVFDRNGDKYGLEKGLSILLSRNVGLIDKQNNI